eukprot:GCRY01002011.1.p1 GENE.GCRY01002011.1~~GCRY01002011.1.p1  ORF type:complete len:343 (+),score=51.77 GCRY01002011.1:131-1159(+)
MEKYMNEDLSLPCRVDQSTLFGRLKHNLKIVDPTTAFVSKKKLIGHLENLSTFKKNWDGQSPIPKSVYRSEQIKNSMVHPDSFQIIPLPFKMSGFTFAALPIAAGMLIPGQGAIGNVFWQVVNQSHNAALNYSNRPIDRSKVIPRDKLYKLPLFGELPKTTVQSYFGACTAAVTASLSLNKLAANMNNQILAKTTPCIAVVLAGVANLVLMRRPELTEGINVTDAKGKVVGLSQNAAYQAVRDTAISRAVLPLPILLIPPFATTAIQRSNWYHTLAQKMPKTANFGMQLSVLTACFYIGIPLAISLFPQMGTISKSKVEKRFQGAKDDEGNEIETFFYNKGL